MLLLRRPLGCVPEICVGRTSCCKEVPRSSETAGPAVIPPSLPPPAADVGAPPSKDGGLIAAAAATAALAWSRALCVISDWDCWDSDSSMVEPAAVLLRPGFLLSCSRGSSWQRWPILRLIHLVQGLSCSEQSVMQWSMVCSPSNLQCSCSMTRQPLTGGGFRKEEKRSGRRGPAGSKKKRSYIRDRMSYAKHPLHDHISQGPLSSVYFSHGRYTRGVCKHAGPLDTDSAKDRAAMP